MADKEGNKTGGRQKGTPNKRSLSAQAIFDEHEFCPLESALARLKKSGHSMDDKLYLDVCIRLMKFKYAELKSVDHTFDPKNATSEELIEQTKKLLAAAEGVK